MSLSSNTPLMPANGGPPLPDPPRGEGALPIPTGGRSVLLPHDPRLPRVPQAPLSEGALASWENEGGSVRATSRDLGEPEHARCHPVLPPGYLAQPAWGFRDRTQQLFYEFNYVYGPPNRLDKRGSTCRLDQNLSYWNVTWSTFASTGDELPAVCSVSYARARKLRGPRLSFERFSSLLQMREDLPRLLHLEDIDVEPPAPRSPAGGAR